jgi:hypothetical protein
LKQQLQSNFWATKQEEEEGPINRSKKSSYPILAAHIFLPRYKSSYNDVVTNIAIKEQLMNNNASFISGTTFG